jgi:hypothetical protein
MFSPFLVEFALEKMVVDIEIAPGDPSLPLSFIMIPRYILVADSL